MGAFSATPSEFLPIGKNQIAYNSLKMQKSHEYPTFDPVISCFCPKCSK